MKTIGLIGGTGWESTAEYYKLINEKMNKRMGDLNFARCILYSFNYADISSLNKANRIDEFFDPEWFTTVFENTPSGFVPLELNLPAVQSFSVQENESANWVDYNHDGLLDIFLVVGGFDISWIDTIVI